MGQVETRGPGAQALGPERGNMKTYRIYNRILQEYYWTDVRAVSAQEACEIAGWLIKNCWVRHQTRGTYAPGWANDTPREREEKHG